MSASSSGLTPVQNTRRVTKMTQQHRKQQKDSDAAELMTTLSNMDADLLHKRMLTAGTVQSPPSITRKGTIKKLAAKAKGDVRQFQQLSKLQQGWLTMLAMQRTMTFFRRTHVNKHPGFSVLRSSLLIKRCLRFLQRKIAVRRAQEFFMDFIRGRCGGRTRAAIHHAAGTFMEKVRGAQRLCANFLHVRAARRGALGKLWAKIGRAHKFAKSKTTRELEEESSALWQQVREYSTIAEGKAGEDLRRRFVDRYLRSTMSAHVERHFADYKLRYEQYMIARQIADMGLVQYTMEGWKQLLHQEGKKAVLQEKRHSIQEAFGEHGAGEAVSFSSHHADSGGPPALPTPLVYSALRKLLCRLQTLGSVEVDTRERMTQYFTKHQPQELKKLAHDLASYQGREASYVLLIEQQFRASIEPFGLSGAWGVLLQRKVHTRTRRKPSVGERLTSAATGASRRRSRVSFSEGTGGASTKGRRQSSGNTSAQFAAASLGTDQLQNQE
jgi:hypothetical protein